MATVRTYSALISELNKRVSVAVEKVADEMVNQLRYYLIEDYYNMYDPMDYDRTYQFQDAPSFEMLSSSMAKIFIDTDSMNYRGISGADVANMASFGFHGSIDIFRPGYFWTDFVAWCDENVPRMLKEELRNQGLNVK